MMKIPLSRAGSLVFDKKHVEVPSQDYMFAAIMKAGPVVSKLDTSLEVLVQDMEMDDGTSMVFRMNVLEQSKLADAHESFLNEGLAAWWKLHDRRDEEPRLSFQEALPKGQSLETLKQFLLHRNSAAFVRHRYEVLFDAIKT